MIRVLQVVTYMGRGGLETMLMNYYRNIDRDVIQFDFLTHRDYKASYDDEIESLGGRIFHLPKLNPFSVKYNHALNNFLIEHSEYKIIHVHQDCMSSVILKAAKKHGIPVRIAHSHNVAQEKNIKYLVKLFYKQSIPKYATELLACGREAGKWMFGGANFKILNNAIDAVKFTYSPEIRNIIRKEFNIPDTIFVVGHVGRFDPQKNHARIIEIFQKINNILPSMLLLVGEGGLRPDIEKKVRDLGLRENVIFTGSRNDVEKVLQAMDVFIFPSHYEGIPVTVIEAQAAGLPCFISDKVPIECKITNLIQQIPLTASPSVWARYAVNAKKVPRQLTYQEIVEAGYDIMNSAKQLQELYIQEHKQYDNTYNIYSNI